MLPCLEGRVEDFVAHETFDVLERRRLPAESYRQRGVGHDAFPDLLVLTNYSSEGLCKIKTLFFCRNGDGAGTREGLPVNFCRGAERGLRNGHVGGCSSFDILTSAYFGAVTSGGATFFSVGSQRDRG